MENEVDAPIEALRSISSIDPVYIRFYNLTDRCVEVTWINFTGHYKRYQLLRKAQYLDVNTYKSHPWMALDLNTKDRLLINNKFVYMPITWKEYVNNQRPNIKYPIIPPEKRIVLRITLPMYSLRFRALTVIRNCLKNPEDVDKLDLPAHLIYDLKKVINVRNKLSSELK